MATPSNLLKKLLAPVACVLAMAAPPAQAAVIVGTFDPAFGGGFTNMGWLGEIRLDVPDTCLAVDGVYNTVTCPGMQTLSARVDLYQLDNPSLFTRLDYTASPSLAQIQVTGGEVVGLQTFGCFECFTYQNPASGLAFAPGYDQFAYGLAFSLTAPAVQLYAAIYAEDVATGSDVEQILFQDADPNTPGFQKGDLYRNCTTRFGDAGVYYECESTGIAKLVITRVPEPGSLALTAGALGLLGLARRRSLR